MKISVYSHPFGKLICHIAHTADPLIAREAVARHFNEVERISAPMGCSSARVNMRLSATRWSLGPFLAVVPVYDDEGNPL